MIMKTKNTPVGKYIFFGLIFLFTAVVTFISTGYKADNIRSMAMTEATLPVVMASTPDGTLYNAMHGYTNDIDESLLKTGTCYLDNDKQLDIVIDTYGESVSGISYKIRTENDLSLIEDTKVSDFELAEGRINAKLKVKNLITDNVPYIMEISLITANHEQASYYTRIVSAKDTGIQEKLDFVLDFNECTFDDSRLDDILRYLESDSSADNSNYGKVTIKNSQYQVGWGDLNPVVDSNIIPTVYEIDGEVALIAIDYTMGAKNSNDEYDTYSVHEFYRIRHASTRMYLLNFDRETTQHFDGVNDLTGKGNINLGISPDTNVTYRASLDNKYIAFVNQGTLWMFDVEKSVYSQVFTFKAEDSDNIRENYQDFGMEILDVDNQGNVEFMVYGHMNRGTHEGEVGISILRYDSKEASSEELIYIPVNVPYDILSENVGELAYISDANVLYILIDDVLYSIDLNSKEVMTEITGLVKDSYKVSSNGRSIAYSSDGGLYNTKTIRVFNVEKGDDYYITGSEGEYLKPLGFIGEDFIYGTARVSDIVTDEVGFITFPMYKLYIIDKDYNTIKTYENEGVYVVGTQVDGMRINLSRVIKNGNGNYVAASIDQLISRDENTEKEGPMVDVNTTTAKKREIFLSLPVPSKAKNATVSRLENVVYKDNATFELSKDVQGESLYYVDGLGVHQGASTNIYDAIAMASDTLGSVTDSNNVQVWKKFKPSSAYIKGISQSRYSLENSLDNARSIVNDYIGEQEVKWLDVKGISLENVLPFVGISRPVIAETSGGYVVIIGYDSDKVTYFDVSAGKEVTADIENAKKMFTQSGNVYITYYKV